jgi:glycosyltransferase involved in cell wall biosynthesis
LPGVNIEHQGREIREMYNGHKVGVVVLAYNVAEFIGDTIRGLPDFADKIYVIDDGNVDKTQEIVKSLNHNRVKLIRHETNMGPGAALNTGYQAALEDKMDITVKVDGDGQMPLDQMENIIIPIVEGKADYARGDRISNRYNRQGMPRFRLVGNLLLTWLTRIASGYWHLNDSQNGFTAISRTALQEMNLKLYPYYGYLNDILIQLNVHSPRVVDIPMPAKYGKEKSSICLRIYIPKLSFFLLRRFLWRLMVKYFRLGNGRTVKDSC